ncbi:MAG: hypothetical protein J7K85_01550 [Anaerolineaceae bacterium]|nr:hypothetical protein [Anaerolineaceae bacterium]
MTTGMIWYNDTKHNELQQVLLQAMDDYQRWYGVAPRQCQVCPGEIPNIRRISRKFHIKLNVNIQLLPGQIWLGG